MILHGKNGIDKEFNMKTKHIFLYTLIFISLIFFGLSLIVSYSTTLTLQQFLQEQTPKTVTRTPITRCNDIEKLPNLGNTNEVHLKKLNEYQEVCNSLAFSRLMIFEDMPKDSIDAVNKASKMVERLIEFDKYGVEPLVIVEPVTEWGLIDFSEFSDGFYDQWITEYFEIIKSKGISDEMMGIWVPFPEANLPYWNRSNAKPEEFGVVVNKYLKILKRHFPQAKASILLNSATYETTDFNWERGEYVSLIPYVSKLDGSLINSFGIQGFPWRTDATVERETKLYDPRQYINTRLAIEAASYLNVKEIWFNTGTFSKKYTLDSERTVYEDPSERGELLDKTIEEALVAKDKGYKVWINLFSENKSDTPEATDWSYWQDYKSDEDPNKYILKDFLKKAYTNELGLSLFDITRELEEETSEEIKE